MQGEVPFAVGTLSRRARHDLIERLNDAVHGLDIGRIRLPLRRERQSREASYDTQCSRGQANSHHAMLVGGRGHDVTGVGLGKLFLSMQGKKHPGVVYVQASRWLRSGARGWTVDLHAIHGAPMRHRCLFCDRTLGRGEDENGFPVLQAAAYDAKKGRLWAICDHCRRWNLWPIEDRSETIEALERLARDRGVPVASTANVTLLRARDVSRGGLSARRGSRELGLVRVGDAGLAERSWWRYGKELERRHAWARSAASRLSGYAYGALAVLGQTVGFAELDQKIRWDHGGLTDLHRWRQFGWAAWRGRLRCPHCESVRRALLYSTSWTVYPINHEGRFALAVPCPRCDFWTPEMGYRLEGAEAEHTLRRVLAYQHIEGASSDSIEAASHAIEASGSAQDFMHQAGDAGTSLWRMQRHHALALEIAVNEAAERRVLQRLAESYDFVWRREEALAQIIDEELTWPR